MLARERGDSMLGTAFEQPGVLLVEQPGPWGHAGLTESRFDSELAVAVEQRARTFGLRTLAVRRPGRSTGDGPRQWALLLPGASSLSWGTYERDSDLLDLPLNGEVGTLDEAPAYFVCAHSKRDQCCAVFGRPVAAALEQLRPGRVWECSHTGGHRYAPIVLALPVGALYGRLDPSLAADVVAATERGEVLPEYLRGVIGHSGPEQAALAYAAQQTGRTAIEAFAVDAAFEATPGQWTVVVTGGGETYDVIVDVLIVPTPYASCGKPTRKPQPQFVPRTLTAR